MSIVTLGKFSKVLTFVNQRQELEAAKKKIASLTVKNPSPHQKVGLLSGGNQQKVVLAKWMARHPKVLILDEPTTYLDICHQLEVLELVSKLNREENITIIMVLHDINQAVRYSSEIFVLENGIIERQGTPIDVMTHDAIADIFEVDADVEMRRGRPSISINGLLD